MTEACFNFLFPPRPGIEHAAVISQTNHVACEVNKLSLTMLAKVELVKPRVNVIPISRHVQTKFNQFSSLSLCHPFLQVIEDSIVELKAAIFLGRRSQVPQMFRKLRPIERSFSGHISISHKQEEVTLLQKLSRIANPQG